MKEFVVNKIKGATIRRDAGTFDREDCLGNSIKRHRHRNIVFKLGTKVRIGRCPPAADGDPGPDPDLIRVLFPPVRADILTFYLT